MAEKIKTNYVDHICIAVNDVKRAEQTYCDMFGWDVAYRYVDEPEKIRVTGFMVGPTAIEVMEDLDGTGPTANFIKGRGEGVMIVSYNVDHIDWGNVKQYWVKWGTLYLEMNNGDIQEITDSEEYETDYKRPMFSYLLDKNYNLVDDNKDASL